MTNAAGAPPPRARDADATRADLLQAAKRRFASLGFERTTSRDIADDAGANVSLIYRYFGSKEKLFEVVLEESADLLEQLRDTPFAELIDRFVAGFEPGANTEYGNQHPLALMLRDVGDDHRARALRERTLSALLTYTAAQIGDTSPARTRAGLLLSLLCGVVTLRAAVPDDPFNQVERDDLRRELHRLAHTLGAEQTLGTESEAVGPPQAPGPVVRVEEEA